MIAGLSTSPWIVAYYPKKDYLSVGLIHISHEKKTALVTLPVEADSGAHRVWVKLDHLKQEQEVPA
jgi:hypothetical protein